MGKKLLVADDSLTIQKVIKLALSHDGYEIQTVADGNELLGQLSLFRPDVVLIDLGLPGKSTFDVKKEVNASDDLRDIPFVLMASAFEKVDEAKVALLKFDGRLTKPFDPSHLRGVLQKAVESRGIPENFNPATLPPPPKPKRETTAPIFTPPPPPESSETGTDGGIALEDPLWSNELPPPPAETGFTLSPSQSDEPHFDSTGSVYHTDEKTDEVVLPTRESAPAPTEDHDIRHLTESTVKMSHLDDLEGWNISESARSSLPPLPSIFDQERPHLETSSPAFRAPPPPTPSRAPSFEDTYPTPPPPPPASGAADLLAELPTSKEIEEMVEQQVRAQLEEMVQDQVSAHLEKFVKSALPEITERIVKAEIRKLLEGLN